MAQSNRAPCERISAPTVGKLESHVNENFRTLRNTNTSVLASLAPMFSYFIGIGFLSAKSLRLLSIKNVLFYFSILYKLI